MKSVRQRMEDVAERIQEAGLSRVSESIQALLRPSFRLSVERPSSESVSRLGGAPNLPAEIAWPSRDDTRPFSFIAQVDLSKLGAMDAFPAPQAGSLFFFYDVVEQPWGFDPKDQAGFKVIYSSSPLSDHPVRTHPDGLEGDSIFKGFSLLPKIEITAPDWDNPSFEELHLNDKESDAYSDLFHSEGLIHRMGGYPDQIQGSLALEAELVSYGIYCGGPKGYEEGRRRGLGPGASDWRLLLQVDSEKDAGMMWGDAGRIYFQIREQDLRDSNFDKVHVALQCG